MYFDSLIQFFLWKQYILNKKSCKIHGISTLIVILYFQMQLIPLNETIYYNLTAMSLSYVYLIAFAYHPIYFKLLYLLYGQKDSVSDQFTSLHLLVRDSNSKEFIQNVTISENYQCLIDCQIDVTASLFLIQSQSLIGIYTMNTNNHTVNFPHYYRIQRFQNYFYLDIINRLADIHSDKFVIIDVINLQIIFGNLLSNDSIRYPLNFDGTATLFVDLSEKSLSLAIKPNWVAIFVYSCMECIYNGSVNLTGSISYPLVIQPALQLVVTQGFRLYKGYSLQNSNLLNGKIIWGFNAGSHSLRILANDTNFEIQTSVTTQCFYSFANRYNFFCFGADTKLYNHSFAKEDHIDVYNYGEIILDLAISNDSSLVAIKASGQNWRIQQYQLAQNCSSYQADTNSLNPLFCNCHLYGSNNQCLSSTNSSTTNSSTTNSSTTNSSTTNSSTTNNSTINNSTTNSSSTDNSTTNDSTINNSTTNNSTADDNLTNINSAINSEVKQSFPITAVIAVVAGLVLVVVSAIVVKKNYKRCTKGRRRVPWKYNPIELMSFES